MRFYECRETLRTFSSVKYASDAIIKYPNRTIIMILNMRFNPPRSRRTPKNIRSNLRRSIFVERRMESCSGSSQQRVRRRNASYSRFLGAVQQVVTVFISPPLATVRRSGCTHVHAPMYMSEYIGRRQPQQSGYKAATPEIFQAG